MKSSYILAATLLFPLCGCSTTMLDKQQIAISKKRIEYTRTSLPEIYNEISNSSTTGALLIVPADGSAKVIIPADNAILAALKADSSINSPDAGCIFVYAHAAALEPKQHSCKELANQAESLAELRSKISAIETSSDKSKADISKLQILMAEYDDAITTSLKTGLINSDLINLQSKQISQLTEYTSYSKEQLSALNKNLDALNSSFESNSKKIEEAVAKLPK